MFEIFRSGGVIMWPMLVIAIGVVVLCVRAAWRRGREGVEGLDGSTSILFWGVVAMVLGVLGSVVGFVQIGQAIMAAGAISQSTLWGGISVALVSTIFGLLILLVALIAWFLLRYQRTGGLDAGRAMAPLA